MNTITPALRARPFLLSFFAVGLLAAFCTRVPLFNYLGFEFSALMAVPAGLAAGIMTIAWRTRGLSAAGWLAGLSILLLLPFLIMAANALVVKNCSFSAGAVYYVLLPVCTVVFSGATAFFLSTLLRRRIVLVFTLLYIAILSHVVIVTLVRPQIFIFNPIMGFFPGFTYDEKLQAATRLLMYRGATCAAALALVLAGRLLLRKRRAADTAEAPARTPRVESVLFAISVVVVIGFFLYSDQLHCSSSEAFIASELGGRRETAHCIIYYPAATVTPAEADDIAELHEFTYQQLAKELRLQQEAKVTSFLYASDEQKTLLLGAGSTDIAKPWLSQIHINAGDVDAVLGHEMTHVLAGEFGLPLLRISPNIGLVEGIAVAADRVQYNENIHRAAAMVLDQGIDPDLETLFSVRGFWTTQFTVSYTLAGSFCRFLIDAYGMPRFRTLYERADFVRAYGLELPQLIAEWKRFVLHIRVDEPRAMKAAYLFKRPSIFFKDCARVIANLNQSVREQMRRGEYESALEGARRSLAMTYNVDAVFLQSRALFNLQRFDSLARFIETQVDDSAYGHAFLPLHLSLGDAYFAGGQFDSAGAEYSIIFDTHLSPGYDETAAIRLESLASAAVRKQLAPLFLTRMTGSVRLEYLRSLPLSPLTAYLRGQELMERGQYREAFAAFSEAGPMYHPFLEHLRQMRLGLCAYRFGEPGKAKTYFWQSLNFSEDRVRELTISRWLDRCTWKEGRK